MAVFNELEKYSTYLGAEGEILEGRFGLCTVAKGVVRPPDGGHDR